MTWRATGSAALVMWLAVACQPPSAAIEPVLAGQGKTYHNLKSVTVVDPSGDPMPTAGDIPF